MIFHHNKFSLCLSTTLLHTHLLITSFYQFCCILLNIEFEIQIFFHLLSSAIRKIVALFNLFLLPCDFYLDLKFHFLLLTGLFRQLTYYFALLTHYSTPQFA